MLAELEKLENNLGGVADLRRQPDAAFIIDLRKEQLAVRETRRLGMPVIALVDTNCDPDEADYVIPGNDDAIRATSLITRAIADGIEAGRQKVTPQELQQEPVEEPPAEAASADETPPEHEVLSQGEESVEPKPEENAEPKPEESIEPRPEEVKT